MFQREDGYYNPGFNVTFPANAMPTSFGGWTKEQLVGWQTTGTVPDFCNESVDTSVFYESAFKQATVAIEGEDMQIEAFLKYNQGQEVYALPTSGEAWQVPNNLVLAFLKAKYPQATMFTLTAVELAKVGVLV